MSSVHVFINIKGPKREIPKNEINWNEFYIQTVNRDKNIFLEKPPFNEWCMFKTWSRCDINGIWKLIGPEQH